MKTLVFLSFLPLLLFASLSFADGMPIDKNGRFIGGKTTVITLTSEQINILSQPEEKWKRIALTDKQREKLMKEAGVSPKLFRFYDTRVGESDCTCEAANRALRFSESEAEIPHDYLKTDKEAAEIDEYH